jgi:hypothetical protein
MSGLAGAVKRLAALVGGLLGGLLPGPPPTDPPPPDVDGHHDVGIEQERATLEARIQGKDGHGGRN